jgi:uncharacterized protein (TIGR03437 family)
MGSQEGRTRLGVTSTGCERARNIFSRLVLALAVLPVLFSGTAHAQARLRLTETTIGPVSVATGANGPTQTIEAFNAGSGALSLTFSSNATWLAATVGASRACQTTQQAACLPINIALNTAALTRGSYTGTITVRDPNAIDAPQTITVIAAVGGGIDDTVFLYTAPNGGSDSRVVTSNTFLTVNPATQSGGNWLTIGYEGQGSFRFVQPYRIIGTHQPGMAEGTYNGTVQFGGSAFAGDNKTVQTRLVVTSQPITFLGPERVAQRLVQGGAAVNIPVGVGNRGLGTASVSSVNATLQNGTGWLSARAATAAEGFTGLFVTLTPGSLTPGTYRGNVAVNNNGINGVLNVPVELEIVAAATPQISFGSVLNNANFARGDTLGVGTIAAVFGEFLAPSALTLSSGAPLPTVLDGTRVLVNGVAAPLYFTSPGQLNFQIPFEATGGQGIVQVERGGVLSNRVTVDIAAVAPRILQWSQFREPYGIIVNQDNTLTMPTTQPLGSFQSRPARAGDVITIYAIGLGRTNPPVATGAAAPAAEPLARLSGVLVRFGARTSFDTSIAVEALFAGLAPTFVGLYQINAIVPQGVFVSEALDLSIEYNGTPSNRVKIATQSIFQSNDEPKGMTP